jgi:glycosyltransferase involved in cell wall biosynthesis
MNYQKNPEGIILACSILKEKGYLFEMLMLGNKDERLIQFSAELGLTDKEIYFESTVPYSEVARRMQESFVLLLFSRFENLPCVILEALCCGLPVISSLTGGIAEVVDANNGILVKNENINELVMAMQKMMDNYAFYDRKDIAEKAVVKFKYDTVARQFMAIYEQLPLLDRS